MLLVCLKEEEEEEPREGEERTRRMTTSDGVGGWKYYMTHVVYSGADAVGVGGVLAVGGATDGAEEDAHGHSDHGCDRHDHVMSSRDLDY